MVTGTPVNSFDNSSIKEVIAGGILGFVVDDVDQQLKHLRGSTLSTKRVSGNMLKNTSQSIQ